MPDGSDRLLFSVHEVAEKRCVWVAASLAMVAERWVGGQVLSVCRHSIWLDGPLLPSTRGQSRGAPVFTDVATAASRPPVEQTAASFFRRRPGVRRCCSPAGGAFLACWSTATSSRRACWRSCPPPTAAGATTFVLWRPAEPIRCLWDQTHVPHVGSNDLRQRCMRMSAPSRLASHMPEVHSKLRQITASTGQYLVGACLARAHDYDAFWPGQADMAKGTT